jgi:hypothetical protein
VQIKKIDFSGQFELKGLWWDPQRPDTRIPGVLIYDCGSITLDLFGLLGDRTPAELGQVQSFMPPLIYGRAEGEYISLYNTTETRRSFFIPSAEDAGDEYSSVCASILVVGCHAPPLNDLRVPSIRVRYTGLEEWLHQAPIQDDNGKENDKSTIGLRFRFPEKLEVTLPALNTRLETDYSICRGSPTFGSRLLRYSSFFRIMPDEDQSLEWFLKLADRCRDFLTFCFGQPVIYRQFILELGDVQYKDPYVIPPREAALFFAQRPNRVGDPPSLLDMILSYPSIKPGAQKVIETWFQKAEELETPIELFLGTFYNRDLYPRFHFLSLAQALETYARLTKPGQYLADSDYKSVKKSMQAAIPCSTPSDLKQSLKSRLEYGNEYSLRKQLKTLASSLKERTSLLISDKMAPFIDQVVNTRNYFTHYTTNLGSVDHADTQTLFLLTHRMRLFLTILILKELGVEEETIGEIILRNQRLNFIYPPKMLAEFQAQFFPHLSTSTTNTEEPGPMNTVTQAGQGATDNVTSQGLVEVLERIQAAQKARGYEGRSVEELEADEAEARAEGEEYEARWRGIWDRTTPEPPDGKS